MVVEIRYRGRVKYYTRVRNIYYGRGVCLVFEDDTCVDIPCRKIDLMRVSND